MKFTRRPVTAAISHRNNQAGPVIVEGRRRLLHKKAGSKGVHLVRDVDKPKETVTRHARKNENSGGLTATLAPLTLWLVRVRHANGSRRRGRPTEQR